MVTLEEKVKIMKVSMVHPQETMIFCLNEV